MNRAWRYDLLCRRGWVVPYRSSDSAPIMGWGTVRHATCELGAHTAPARDCTCGLHSVLYLSEQVAAAVEAIAEARDLAQVQQDIPPDEIALCLSIVEVPDDVEPRRYYADPPSTVRSARHRYAHVYTDRGWPLTEAPERLRPRFEHVPDLPAWIRHYVALGRTAP
ncbi:hypothetical protein ACMYYO_13130 [Dermacoccaceae bacterium W4C1]